MEVKLHEIRLIAYDFDGVMTDNKVYVDQDGKETVKVNRADGLGVAGIRKLGIEQIIISTEKNPVVQARAEKMELPVYQGVDNKMITLSTICTERGLAMSQVAFVGNDINDFEAMQFAGLAICPADSATKILKISDLVVKKNGGDGVIRELFNIIQTTRS